MAKSFRLGTFNVENLFARYRFKDNAPPSVGEGFTINDTAFDILDETEKQITAKVIRDLKADVLCLQEVESLPVLDRFASRYLGSMKYRHRMLVDGNDPRYIDVAVLSRFPIANVRSYRHERTKARTADLFSRDCLEVDIDVQGKTLTLYVNHFKSMIRTREETHARRKEQVERVAEIVRQRWESSGYDGNFVVLGDFNDHLEPPSALDALLKHPELVNLLTADKIGKTGKQRVPVKEQWTHFWAGGNEYRQLDYVLLGKSFDKRAGGPSPVLIRKGLPWRAEDYDGARYDEVGQNEPKASDHVPLAVDIPLAALK